MDDPEVGNTDSGGGGDSTPAVQQSPDSASPSPQAPPTSAAPGPGAAAAPAPPPQPAASLAPKPPTAKRTGLAGVVDSMLDDLAGTTGAAKMRKGDDGNYYVETPELSRKGQWLKIAGEALHGAAAGAAQMQGPGAAGRGLAAGVEAGDKLGAESQKNDQQVTQAARQAKRDRFNQIKLQHDMAMWAFEEAHAQHQGTEDEIKFNNEEMAREAKPVEQGGLGSQDLGVHRDMAELASQMSKTHPEVWKHMYGDTQGSGVVGYKEYDPSGKVTGIHFFARTPGVNGQFLPEDQATFKVFKPGKTAQDPPTFEQQKATVPLTVGQQTSYNAAADIKMSQWQETQRKAAKDAADLERVKAETRASNASARHSDAETGAIRDKADADKSPDPALVDSIRKGTVAATTLGRMLSGKDGQKLLAAVEAGGDVDTSKLAAYPKVYADYTSGKTSVALNAGGTALKHLAELQQLNTLTSRVPGSADSKAFDDKLDTLVPELIKFYGMPDTNETVRSLKGTLGGLMNRDAAIASQVKSLGDKMDSYHQTWRNAAPSAAYEAPMPNIDDEAKMARAELDPKYANRLFSVSKWKAANPQGDAAAARAAAMKQGMDTVE